MAKTLHALELVGFFLAFADFSGLSRNLEDLLDRFRTAYNNFFKILLLNRTFQVGAALAIVLQLCTLAIPDSVARELLPFDYCVSDPAVDAHEIWAESYPNFYIFLSTLVIPAVILLTIFCTTALALLLHIINIPRKGMVGTIAFAIAGMSLASRFVTGN